MSIFRVPSAKFQTKKFFTRSVLFFAILVAIVYFIQNSFYTYLIDNEKDHIRHEESISVETISIDALGFIEEGLSDAKVIAATPIIKSFGSDPSPANREALDQFLAAFISRTEGYDEISLLDLTGAEMARVEFNQRRPNIIEEKNLRPAGACGFFKDLQTLADDAYFISNFNLTIDNCVLEIPLKPVIRVAVPIVDQNSQRFGYLVLYRLAAEILGEYNYNNDLSDNESYVLMVNPDGYYVVNQLDPFSNFGFLLDENADRNMAIEYPEAWAAINSEKNGQIWLADGIFTFDTIDLHSGKVLPFHHQRLSISSYYPEYKVISFFPTANIIESFALLDKTHENIMILLLIGSFIIATGAALGIGLISMNRRSLEEQALHDALTGLPNRKFFMQQLSNSLQLNRRRSDVTTVFFIDLDGFKAINDTYGHHAGDHMLKHIADSVYSALRKTDFLARLGGDEFVAISYDVSNEIDAATVAERILTAVATPTVYKDISMSLTASIGVAIQADQTGDVDLLSEADHAMYEAKNSGKNKYSIRIC